jgi:hypothetical protein
LPFSAGLPDFTYLEQLTKMGKIYKKTTKYIYSMAIKYISNNPDIRTGIDFTKLAENF